MPLKYPANDFGLYDMAGVPNGLPMFTDLL
jgi:hypothetical protein